MSKRTIVNAQELDIVQHLRPAAVIGLTNKITLEESLIPEEFRGATVEILEGAFAPTVKWNAIGDFVAGVYQKKIVVSVKRKTGLEDNNLYYFDANGKEFAVWGTTMLDQQFDAGLTSGVISPGRKVLIAYVGDLEVNQPQDMKMFQVRVAQIAKSGQKH